MFKRFFKKEKESISPVEVSLPEVNKDLLYFDTLNFKLAVLQVLMYDLNVLDTQFDLYEFVDEYTPRPIYLQEEGFDIIPEVIEYFKDFEIDADFAQYITEINMDRMHEIYTHIYPFWEQDDATFDIDFISEKERSQFSNLKVSY